MKKEAGKITAKMLTHEALAEIVDAVIEAGVMPQTLLISWYKDGLVKQLKTINKQLEAIKLAGSNKKITRKEYISLCAKERRLCAIGNKKLEILKGFDNATDSNSK